MATCVAVDSFKDDPSPDLRQYVELISMVFVIALLFYATSQWTAQVILSPIEIPPEQHNVYSFLLNLTLLGDCGNSYIPAVAQD